MFKALAESDPRGLLDLFGSLPLTADARITLVDRELVAQPLFVDHAYRIESGGEKWVEHFEATTRVPGNLKDRFARYCYALAMGCKLPVRSSLVLLSPRHAPKDLVPVHRLDLGALKMEVEFRIIRLWELDAGKIIAEQRPKLLAWVPLLNCTERQIAAVSRRVMKADDPSLIATFEAWGGLRFGEDQWKLLGERIKMNFTPEAIEDIKGIPTPIADAMWRAIRKGRLEGKLEGKLEGRLEGKLEGKLEGDLKARRDSIRTCLALRFPSLGKVAELDSISDESTLEQLLREAVTAGKPDSFLKLLSSQSKKSTRRRSR